MNFELCELRSLGPELGRQATELLSLVFPAGPAVSVDRLLATTNPPDAAAPTRYFAAFAGPTMIGFNAFVSTPFRRGEEAAVAFQSCWSATHPAHQGKGVWAALMNLARDQLRQSALFIFGIPNPNSHPIMVRKLGYREVPVLATLIPALPAAFGPWLDKAGVTIPAGYVPDERAIAKSKMLGSGLRQSSAGGAYAWGKVEKSKWKRMPVDFARVGGIGIERDGADLARLLGEFARGSPAFIHIVLSSSHELAPAFPRLKPLAGVRPFVVLDLQTGSSDPLNIMFGVTDVF